MTDILKQVCILCISTCEYYSSTKFGEYVIMERMIPTLHWDILQ